MGLSPGFQADKLLEELEMGEVKEKDSNVTSMLQSDKSLKEEDDQSKRPLSENQNSSSGIFSEKSKEESS